MQEVCLSMVTGLFGLIFDIAKQLIKQKNAKS